MDKVSINLSWIARQQLDLEVIWGSHLAQLPFSPSQSVSDRRALLPSLSFFSSHRSVLQQVWEDHVAGPWKKLNWGLSEGLGLELEVGLNFSCYFSVLFVHDVSWKNIIIDYEQFHSFNRLQLFISLEIFTQNDFFKCSFGLWKGYSNNLFGCVVSCLRSSILIFKI